MPDGISPPYRKMHDAITDADAPNDIAVCRNSEQSPVKDGRNLSRALNARQKAQADGIRLGGSPAEYSADRASDRADWAANSMGPMGAPSANTGGMAGFGRRRRIDRSRRFTGRGAQACFGSIGVGQDCQDYCEDCYR